MNYFCFSAHPSKSALLLDMCLHREKFQLYQCMGQTLAHRVGADPRYGHDKKSKTVVFEPHTGKDWKVVNMDATIKPSILRAR